MTGKCACNKKSIFAAMIKAFNLQPVSQTLTMADLSQFDPNNVGNPNNNIFGLPFTEDDARLIILPVPWEVTVSYGAGTARAAEHIRKASVQILSLIHISEPTRQAEISYAVFCLKK